MNDKELLELAAKAAGIKKDAWGTYIMPICPDGVLRSSSRGWNPLEDDGDAMRLAVKLGLIVCVMIDSGVTGIYLPSDGVGGKYDFLQSHLADPYASTRLAIVEAAAFIDGKL